jgi:hypothetical protein
VLWTFEVAMPESANHCPMALVHEWLRMAT